MKLQQTFSYLKTWLVILFYPLVIISLDIAVNVLKRLYFPSPSEIINSQETNSFLKEEFYGPEKKNIPKVINLGKDKSKVIDKEVKKQNTNNNFHNNNSNLREDTLIRNSFENKNSNNHHIKNNQQIIKLNNSINEII